MDVDENAKEEKDNDNDNADAEEFVFDEDDTVIEAQSSENATASKRAGVEEGGSLMAYRGVDFREVAAVINFNAPRQIRSYVHRAGRTARAGNYGVCISMVTPREMKAGFRRVMFQRVNSDGEAFIEPLPLSMSDLEPFRYRCASVRCKLTPGLVKQARLNELRMEILNSQRMQSHFKERKREFELLRHDKMLQPADFVKAHLSQIPSYMLNNTALGNAPNRKENAKGLGREEASMSNEGKRYFWSGPTEQVVNKKVFEGTAVKLYQQTFGTLPREMRRVRAKFKRWREEKDSPGKKKQRKFRNKYNRKHPLKQFDTEMLKNYGFLNNSTLLEKHAKAGVRRHQPVHLKPVKSWKAPMKTNRVQQKRQKPSLRGLSKRQVKKLRKRQKMKALGKRRK